MKNFIFLVALFFAVHTVAWSSQSNGGVFFRIEAKKKTVHVLKHRRPDRIIIIHQPTSPDIQYIKVQKHPKFKRQHSIRYAFWMAMIS